jgi:hypothetical protein
MLKDHTLQNYGLIETFYKPYQIGTTFETTTTTAVKIALLAL